MAGAKKKSLTALAATLDTKKRQVDAASSERLKVKLRELPKAQTKVDAPKLKVAVAKAQPARELPTVKAAAVKPAITVKPPATREVSKPAAVSTKAPTAREFPAVSASKPAVVTAKATTARELPAVKAPQVSRAAPTASAAAATKAGSGLSAADAQALRMAVQQAAEAFKTRSPVRAAPRAAVVVPKPVAKVVPEPVRAQPRRVEKDDGITRRAYPRSSVDVRARLALADDPSRTFEATLPTVNISVGGVFLSSSFFLKAGTRLLVELALPPHGRIVKTKAEVVRVESNGRSGIALRFTEYLEGSEVALATHFLAPVLRTFLEAHAARLGFTPTVDYLAHTIDVLAAWELKKAELGDVWTVATKDA